MTTKEAKMQVQSTSTSIEQIARFIRSLDRREKRRLVQLVPELTMFQAEPDSLSNSREQDAVLEFFDSISNSEAPPLPENEMFVEGLTFAQFFGLPDEEQAVVWQMAHNSAETQLANSQ